MSRILEAMRGRLAPVAACALVAAAAGCGKSTVVRPDDDTPIVTLQECTGWNAGDTEGWVANTVQTTIAVIGDGGVSGGWLRSTSSGNWGVAGAVNPTLVWSGDYGAHGYGRLTASVRFLAGAFDSAVFRVRYQDARYNGWRVPLPCDLAAPGWQEVVVPFDPGWSDDEARAAGWVQEDYSASFAATMSRVFQPEIRVHGKGSLVLGLDDVCLGKVR